jgi:ribosomal-protein-alanine N-acetyltransferase
VNRTEQLTLGPLRQRDIRRCVELEQVLFPGDDPWSRKMFARELCGPNRYLGAYAGGSLVGYAGLALLAGPPRAEAEVHTMAVDPAAQGRGVGTSLLRGLLARADEDAATVYLEVRTDNHPAIRLYERHGFTRVGLRRRYYQPSGADAYTMKRELQHER